MAFATLLTSTAVLYCHSEGLTQQHVTAETSDVTAMEKLAVMKDTLHFRLWGASIQKSTAHAHRTQIPEEGRAAAAAAAAAYLLAPKEVWGIAHGGAGACAGGGPALLVLLHSGCLLPFLTLQRVSIQSICCPAQLHNIDYYPHRFPA